MDGLMSLRMGIWSLVTSSRLHAVIPWATPPHSIHYQRGIELIWLKCHPNIFHIIWLGVSSEIDQVIMPKFIKEYAIERFGVEDNQKDLRKKATWSVFMGSPISSLDLWTFTSDGQHRAAYRQDSRFNFNLNPTYHKRICTRTVDSLGSNPI